MEHQSLWQKTALISDKFPAMHSDVICDAVVVGAGLTGVLTAWKLQKQGLDVVVLDSGTPGQGATALTTAKITALHGFIYSNLITSHGIELAKLYFRANQSAIEHYSDLIHSENIPCDFQRVDCFLYARSASSNIQKEKDALTAIGESLHITTDTQLPFPVSSAIKIENQAVFHPLKFLYALLPHLRVYKNSTVTKISDNKVITDRAVVIAKHIVIATRYPFFLFPGLFFSRMHQERSYALSITNVPRMKDMYIDAENNGITFRPWNEQVILGGFSHRTGHTPIQNGYDTLQLCAQHWYPECKPTAQWSTEDCIPAEQIPYIGSFKHGRAQVHVATGFQKWGISSAMVAAEILTDSIFGRSNTFSSLFTPHRFPGIKAMGRILHNGLISSGNLAKQIFFVPRAKLHHIPPGHGGIVQWNGRKTGVFHREDGTYYFVSPRCPHMGCQLTWNQAELSWDCPCHGSRFNYNGKRLDPPSAKNLPCNCHKTQKKRAD